VIPGPFCRSASCLRVVGNDSPRSTFNCPCSLTPHRLLKNAVLAIFAAIGVLVLSVIVIGAAVTSGSGGVGVAALALVLAGTTTLLVGLLMATRSILMSQDAIYSEVRRALSLGS